MGMARAFIKGFIQFCMMLYTNKCLKLRCCMYTVKVTEFCDDIL